MGASASSIEEATAQYDDQLWQAEQLEGWMRKGDKVRVDH